MYPIQDVINDKMRVILIDWLLEVCVRYKLNNLTLHACIECIDKYLSSKPIGRDKLQLLGITSLWLSSKLHEIYPPVCSDMTLITDNTYTNEQVKSMEVDIITTIEFQMLKPCKYGLLRQLMMKCNITDPKIIKTCDYIYHIIVRDFDHLQYDIHDLMLAILVFSCDFYGIIIDQAYNDLHLHLNYVSTTFKNFTTLSNFKETSVYKLYRNIASTLC